MEGGSGTKAAAVDRDTAAATPESTAMERRAAAMETATATVEAAAVATATMVLRLAGTGRHEDCRPGKEQQAAE